MTTFSIKNLTDFPKAVPAGSRLARIIRKATKEEKAAGITPPASQGCYVPALSRNVFDVVAASEEGQEYLFKVLYTVQNNLIRDALEEGKSINEEIISASSIIKWIGDNVEESVRLTDKVITEWFDKIAKKLIVASFMSTRGMNEAMAIQVAMNYLPLFKLTISKDSTFASDDVSNKVKALTLVVADGDESVLTQKIVKRISEMQVFAANRL